MGAGQQLQVPGEPSDRFAPLAWQDFLDMISTSQLTSHTHLSQYVVGTSKQSPECQTETSPDKHALRKDKT